jgi:hypothetical protein
MKCLCANLCLLIHSRRYFQSKWPVYDSKRHSVKKISPSARMAHDRWLTKPVCSSHHHPDDKGSRPMHPWNVGLLQRYYTALYPRRLSSSCSPPWEPKISRLIKIRGIPECHVTKFGDHCTRQSFVSPCRGGSSSSSRSKAVPLHAMEALGGEV